MRDMFSPPSDDLFSRGGNDAFELLKAWAGSTLAFAIVQVGGNLLTPVFVQALLISAVVCGLAFVLHELAHRVVARGYGAEAHFVANNPWLLISIALAFTGFFIAAPGAVWHRGYLTPRQSGLIALAGPATNYALAVAFLLLLVGFELSGVAAPLWLLVTCELGYRFNAFLGLFNMIPAGPFDGAKVLNWDWRVFAVAAGTGILLTFVLNDRVIASILRAL